MEFNVFVNEIHFAIRETKQKLPTTKQSASDAADEHI
jgi:hypothetical protein